MAYLECDGSGERREVPDASTLLAEHSIRNLTNAHVTVDFEESGARRLELHTPGHLRRRLQNNDLSDVGPPLFGPASVLVIRISTPTDSALDTGYTDAYFDEVLWGDNHRSVNNFFSFISHGATWFDQGSSAYETVELDIDPTGLSSCSTSMYSIWGPAAEARLTATGGPYEGLVLREVFDHVAFFFPYSSSAWTGCRETAFAFLRSYDSYYVTDDTDRTTTVHHELGHNKRFLHGNRDFEGESLTEYGDHTDIMGIDWCWGLLNAPHRHEAGWLHTDAIVHLPPGYTDTVTIGNLIHEYGSPGNTFGGQAKPTAFTAGYEWELYSETSQYWVSYVSRVDPYFQEDHFSSSRCFLDEADIVQIHRWSSDTPGTYLLAQLSVGESYTTDTGFRVTFVSSEAITQSAQVDIANPGTVCTSLFNSFSTPAVPLVHNYYEPDVDKFLQWERRFSDDDLQVALAPWGAPHAGLDGTSVALVTFPLDGPACSISYSVRASCGTESEFRVEIRGSCHEPEVVPHLSLTGDDPTCLSWQRYTVSLAGRSPACTEHVAFVVLSRDDDLAPYYIDDIDFSAQCFEGCGGGGTGSSTCPADVPTVSGVRNFKGEVVGTSAALQTLCEHYPSDAACRSQTHVVSHNGEPYFRLPAQDSYATC